MTRPAKPPTAQLHIRLINVHGKPLDVGAVLLWGPDLVRLRTNADGVLIPDGSDPSATPPPPVIVSRRHVQGELDVLVDGNPANVLVTLTIFLSDFEGADEVRGTKARLNNLGHLSLAGPPAKALTNTMDPAATDALMRYRRTKGISPITGSAIDVATADALMLEHDT